MNQSQVRYFMERVNNLYREKDKKLKEKFTIPGKELSKRERANLIKSGKVKLKSDVKEIKGYDTVEELFDFSKYEWDEKLNSKYHEELSRYMDRVNQAKDSIMLGDEEEALKLIKLLEE